MPATASLLIALLLPVAQGTLRFTAPPDWTAKPASSAMRIAEYALPRAAGAPEDADLVVYFFGGQGGDIEANVTRWIGQMQQPDGRASKDVAARRTVTANGLTVTVLDVPGTYIAEVRPGATERFN